MEAGFKVFGQPFKQYLEKNKELIIALPQNKFMEMIQKCNTNGPSYLK